MSKTHGGYIVYGDDAGKYNTIQYAEFTGHDLGEAFVQIDVWSADAHRDASRIADALNLASRMHQGIVDAVAERERQEKEEGWTKERDDGYDSEELAYAAACYAGPIWTASDTETARAMRDEKVAPTAWPWLPDWWKPSTRRRDMVKAVALLLAEIDRIDRAELREAVSE